MNITTISDPYAREVDGSYYTRTNYAGDTSANPPLISLQVPGEGKMTVHYGDGSKQDVTAWNVGGGIALSGNDEVSSEQKNSLDDFLSKLPRLWQHSFYIRISVTSGAEAT